MLACGWVGAYNASPIPCLLVKVFRWFVVGWTWLAGESHKHSAFGVADGNKSLASQAQNHTNGRESPDLSLFVQGFGYYTP